MNTCKHCGNQWTDKRIYCPACGTRLVSAKTQTDMIPLSIHESVCELAYRKLMAEIEKHRWFTVDERPDNMPDQVICHWEDGTVETFSSQNIDEWNQAHPEDKITHWMFSPEPPGP